MSRSRFDSMLRTARRHGGTTPVATAGAGLAGAAVLAAGVVVLVRSMGGVRGIRDKLHSRMASMKSASSETRMEASDLDVRVADSLMSDSRLKHRPIDVGMLDDHTIELSGRVSTLKESARAAAMAGKVAGVKEVVNNLVVGMDAPGLSDVADRSTAYSASDDFSEKDDEANATGTNRRPLTLEGREILIVTDEVAP